MKFRKFLTSPVTTIASFALAAALLLTSGIGGARAALTYFSENYTSRVQMYDIGVSLLENGTKVSYRDYDSAADGSWNEATGALLGKMVGENETFKLGVAYPEALTVQNTGNINQYVRVSIYKYWLDKDGNKMQTLSPDLIDLRLVNTGSKWLIDQAATTAERTVLYYNSLLRAGATSAPLSDTITVDGTLATKVTQTETKVDGGTKITTTYDYDGVSFAIEATVDAVQEHNAQDAILSAWGRSVNVSGNTLTLN